MLKSILRKVLPESLRRTLRREPPLYAESYSLEGEDMVLRRIFWEKKDGFFVDVGAHDPATFSNTLWFYKNGWRGINIDAMPGSMKAFERYRPLDINVEAAVSDTPQELTYYSFNEPALNGFDPTLSKERDGEKAARVIDRIPIKTKTLAEILDQHLPPGQAIDFLTIDVEGFDLKVLQSNDWKKYRPAMVLAEDLQADRWEQINDSKITVYLLRHGYRPYARTVRTIFYKRDD